MRRNAAAPDTDAPRFNQPNELGGLLRGAPRGGEWNYLAFGCGLE